jgi:sulfonate transport system ATP-binding protein
MSTVLDSRAAAHFQSATTKEKSSPGALIQLQGIDKAYGDRQVISQLDLRIEPGQFVALIGRSGCGKTTLLRLLAGLDLDFSGQLLLDHDSVHVHKRDVRIMFQDSRLLPWKTVSQNVAIGLKGNRYDIQDRVQDALEQVGLTGRGEDWPKHLSGGQKQRVALARALLHRPRLLLLDEPLGALDALTRLETQRLIERIWHQHQFTTLLVTHDVSEAVILADRIILMESGRIVLDESVTAIRPRHQGNPEVAEIEHRVLQQLMTSN